MLSRRLVLFCKLDRSSGPPGGRPHARLKAGTPPRSPDPRANDETLSPQQRFDAARGPKQRGEHQPSRRKVTAGETDVEHGQDRSACLGAAPLLWLTYFHAGPSPLLCVDTASDVSFLADLLPRWAFVTAHI